MNKRNLNWTVLLIAGFVLAAVVPALAAEEDTRYQTVTIRGKLTDPSADVPMAGATVRFTSTGEGGNWVEAVTNDKGEFVLEGLSFATYAVEITTREGESIKAINSVPISKDTVSVTLRLSERIASTTTLENDPARFAAAVEVKGVNWKRFWKQFAIFFGVAAGVGAAAL